jgi:hypothetical protein
MLLFGIYVYSTDPLVFSVPDNFVPRLLKIMPRAVSEKATILVFPTWTKEPWSQVSSTAWRLRSLPKERTIFMCSTHKEKERLKWAGFKTRWCHQNLFCNEDELNCSPSSERTFDAVYTAVLSPYKRHHLLTGITNLRLITGSTAMLDELPKMGLANVTVNDRYLTKREIADILSQCKCGLALSEEEGGMLASTEYLLSGLPVVSTPSIGGRDIYYNSSNHILCEPTVDAVTRAVEMASQQDWDHAGIRAQAIEKSREFRFRLAECVREVAGKSPFDAAEITGSWFTRNFLAVHFMQEFFDSYTSQGFKRLDLLGKFA